MTILTETTPARAGLLGNPSDGYHGKSLSVALANFRARVTLEPAATIVIGEETGEREEYPDLAALLRHLELHGLEHGAVLVKATIKRFAGYCRDRAIALPEKRFALRYETDIPRQVGLAGSSAIITATLRALLRFFEVSIPLAVRPTLALETETVELGIEAGPQDRVVQAFGGLVYMDFGRAKLEAEGRGDYERMDPARLPPLYVAYRPDLQENSGAALSPLRQRVDGGDRTAIDTLARIAELAAEGRDALLDRDVSRFRQLMDRNFDLRRTILAISDSNLELVSTARAAGASAKFAGSGGSIVGVCDDDRMFAELETRLGALGASVFQVTPAREETDV